MAFNFLKPVSLWSLKKLLAAAFDTSSGHNHDGANSKAVTVGTVASNAVDTAQIKANALAASTAGRGKIADDFFDNATCDAKFAANAFAADADSRAIFADGIWTLAKLAQEAKTHVLTVPIAALTANSDMAATPFFVVPTGFVANILSASITPTGDSSGINDANTSVWALTDGTNTLATKTFKTDPAFPASGTTTDLGTIDTDHDNLAAGTQLKASVTNGTLAATPATLLEVVYYLSAA